MYLHTLKIHIATTLFTLLALAMLLINLVIFIFWQQHLIEHKIQQSKITVTRWSRNHLFSEDGARAGDAGTQLEELKMDLGPEWMGVIFTDSSGNASSAGTTNKKFEQLINTALGTKKELTERIDSPGIPSFIRPKLLATTFIPEVTGSKTIAIGALLDTSIIFKQLWRKEPFILFYILFNALVLATIGFFRMKRRLLNPVEKLVAVSEAYQVAEGSGLFLDHTENEIGQLSRSMGNMVQRIEADRSKLFDTVNCLKETNKRLHKAQDEIIHAEKLAAAGRLSAGLAHEIGNPLAIVQGYLELLQDNTLTEDSREQFSARAMDELERISRLLTQLIDITRTKTTENDIVYPIEVIEELLDVLSSPLNKQQIVSSYSTAEPDIAIWADRELFRQVLLNCLLNSIDAVSERTGGSKGGKIEVRMKSTRLSDGTYVCIEIEDNGTGISDENIHLIFEPFFTTKEPGKGTGLGLAVSFRIINSLGGRMEVESTVDTGAVFRISLPPYQIEK